mmetsp:Transcript_4834/g.13432  ORF Transcript_4834/g.13432 Transcript_4834/m.13432 type:complete len:200 (+) Transcript_4834:1317-1916(+)
MPDNLHEADHLASVAHLLQQAVLVLVEVEDGDVVEGPRIHDLRAQTLGKVHRLVGLDPREDFAWHRALQQNDLLAVRRLHHVKLHAHVIGLMRVDDDVGVGGALEADELLAHLLGRCHTLLRGDLGLGGQAGERSELRHTPHEQVGDLAVFRGGHGVHMALRALQQGPERRPQRGGRVLRREDALGHDAKHVLPVGSVQ